MKKWLLLWLFAFVAADTVTYSEGNCVGFIDDLTGWTIDPEISEAQLVNNTCLCLSGTSAGLSSVTLKKSYEFYSGYWISYAFWHIYLESKTPKFFTMDNREIENEIWLSSTSDVYITTSNLAATEWDCFDLTLCNAKDESTASITKSRLSVGTFVFSVNKNDFGQFRVPVCGFNRQSHYFTLAYNISTPQAFQAPNITVPETCTNISTSQQEERLAKPIDYAWRPRITGEYPVLRIDEKIELQVFSATVPEITVNATNITVLSESRNSVHLYVLKCCGSTNTTDILITAPNDKLLLPVVLHIRCKSTQTQIQISFDDGVWKDSSATEYITVSSVVFFQLLELEGGFSSSGPVTWSTFNSSQSLSGKFRMAVTPGPQAVTAVLGDKVHCVEIIGYDEPKVLFRVNDELHSDRWSESLPDIILGLPNVHIEVRSSGGSAALICQACNLSGTSFRLNVSACGLGPLEIYCSDTNIGYFLVISSFITLPNRIEHDNAGHNIITKVGEIRTLNLFLSGPGPNGVADLTPWLRSWETVELLLDISQTNLLLPSRNVLSYRIDTSSQVFYHIISVQLHNYTQEKVGFQLEVSVLGKVDTITLRYCESTSIMFSSHLPLDIRLTCISNDSTVIEVDETRIIGLQSGDAALTCTLSNRLGAPILVDPIYVRVLTPKNSDLELDLRLTTHSLVIRNPIGVTVTANIHYLNPHHVSRYCPAQIEWSYSDGLVPENNEVSSAGLQWHKSFIPSSDNSEITAVVIWGGNRWKTHQPLQAHRNWIPIICLATFAAITFTLVSVIVKLKFR